MIDKNKISIKPINKSHLSKLRLWKNQNKNYFFHKDLITQEDQTKWYQLFKSRKNDYMFVITNNNSLVGCMGIRLINDEWDVYNVILGNLKYSKKGIMSIAFLKMIGYALSLKKTKISLKVLKNNPAIIWYKKQNFEIINSNEIFHTMIYKNNNKI